MQEPLDAEIIIYANPSSPPYFIPALQRIWKDITFDIKTHCHSSVIEPKTSYFEEKLLSVTTNNIHSIDITLIWKKGFLVLLKKYIFFISCQ